MTWQQLTRIVFLPRLDRDLCKAQGARWRGRLIDWSLAGLVVLVADLGPGADWAVKRRGLDGWDHTDLWPSLEAVSSTVLVGGYVGRLS